MTAKQTIILLLIIIFVIIVYLITKTILEAFFRGTTG